MRTFSGTNIPYSILSKSQLADHLGITTTTLRRWTIPCEAELTTIPGYNKYSKLLSPLSIEIILKYHGVIRPNS